MAYEHPLAYVLGLEGVSLLRAFAGEYGREFTEARIAEIRRLVDEAERVSGVEVEHVDSVEGYGIWASRYDAPDNPAFDFGGAMIRAVAANLPCGMALDAACGTGRVAALMAECGHQVIGVDSSAEMLAVARERLPKGDFRLGDLRELPVESGSVDVAACALALTHLPELEPVLGEFARALRPGGQLVIADVHPEQVARGRVPTIRRADGTAGRVRSYHHRAGDYVRAALAAGLLVRGCEEPVAPAPTSVPPRSDDPGPWDAWPWSLGGLAPEAAQTAGSGVPAMILWHFQRPE
ncbi:class I SAM-dependent methyltransferase [Nocardia sp. CA-084685]|uniref:class I SAM-dependent methyltransferase n=1 Tax=Nocardia sp. CA-084685 TaxID=3239970 RepID=UPI003D9742D5